MNGQHQTSVFRGIYEFEDPGGSLLATRIPHRGSADLYYGTIIVVRPNQCVLFFYKGKIADMLQEGTHSIQTGNVPILTRLANWRFGFKSPLRCEIWFFSNQVTVSRRWGTIKPVLYKFPDMNSIPIRAYGNYNIVLKDPKKFYMTLIGSRTSYDISELEEFVQGQILELFPKALVVVKNIEDLNKSQDEVSRRLQIIVNRVLTKYGLQIIDLQVLSLLPSEEIIKALDAKIAMNIIGNKQEYLLYRAADSLNELQSRTGANQSNDPMQMMLGLMLGKSLISADFREKERAVISRMTGSGDGDKEGYGSRFCLKCKSKVRSNDKFCSLCGEKQS